MREKAATCEEFVEANSQTSCINLMPVYAQNDGIARLLEIASFRRVTFETRISQQNPCRKYARIKSPRTPLL